MNQTDLQTILDHARKKTLELLDSIAALPNAAAVLGWRPGPGRAHLAWQFMHIAATDDRHLNVRMRGGEPASADFVKRFAGGSTPDDAIPSGEQIRTYLTERRRALADHLAQLRDVDLSTKPTPQAPWPYDEWFRVLAWHEAHHQGQAHLTLNLYRAAQEPGLSKVGY
jgi:uncharacterized damage-inducible protein DinB